MLPFGKSLRKVFESMSETHNHTYTHSHTHTKTQAQGYSVVVHISRGVYTTRSNNNAGLRNTDSGQRTTADGLRTTTSIDGRHGAALARNISLPLKSQAACPGRFISSHTHTRSLTHWTHTEAVWQHATHTDAHSS